MTEIGIWDGIRSLILIALLGGLAGLALIGAVGMVAGCLWDSVRILTVLYGQMKRSGGGR